MMTLAQPRRRAGQRISSALWGLLVAGMGVLLIASYSGYDIDFGLAAIIVLAAVGGWLLISAAVSGIGRQREISRATAPTVEEYVAPASASSADASEGDENDVDDTATVDVAPTEEFSQDDLAGEDEKPRS